MLPRTWEISQGVDRVGAEDGPLLGIILGFEEGDKLIDGGVLSIKLGTTADGKNEGIIDG